MIRKKITQRMARNGNKEAEEGLVNFFLANECSDEEKALAQQWLANLEENCD